MNVTLVSRQRAAHTALLLTGAAAWLIGNLLYALDAQPAAVVPWWFSFLVLSIAAERLEMTRLMRSRPGAAAALYVCLGLMLAGSGVFALSPVWGGWLYGLSLVELAAWLICFDIARRTISAHGLSRYMAVCLLLGYGWLGVSGAAWMATSMGYAARDVALHALGLGFIFSMMLGHAPVILPALARVKLLFGWWFYVPLTLLHASLAVRLVFGPFDFAHAECRRCGQCGRDRCLRGDRAGFGCGMAREAPGLVEETPCSPCASLKNHPHRRRAASRCGIWAFDRSTCLRACSRRCRLRCGRCSSRAC